MLHKSLILMVHATLGVRASPGRRTDSQGRTDRLVVWREWIKGRLRPAGGYLSVRAADQLIFHFSVQTSVFQTENQNRERAGGAHL